MIYFLAKRDGLWGIRVYLRVAGKTLAGRVSPIPYETLLERMTRDFWWARAKETWWRMSSDSFPLLSRDGIWKAERLAWRLLKWLRATRTLPRGAYVFADIERLSPEETVRADYLWKALARSGRGVRLLNHPTRSMRRYELLRTLYEANINSFNVYRLTEARLPVRYPVFLRGENDHEGPRSALLHTRGELEDAVRQLDEGDQCREGMIITEFCDTADTKGNYRKYGAFVIGERICPKHLTFSRYWANQKPDLTEDEMLAEEREYVEQNPHEAQLREICRLAQIEYAKIDYGVLGGKVQVWEITTNPTINSPKRRRHPARREILELFDERVGEALRRLLAD